MGAEDLNWLCCGEFEIVSDSTVLPDLKSHRPGCMQAGAWVRVIPSRFSFRPRLVSLGHLSAPSAPQTVGPLSSHRSPVTPLPLWFRVDCDAHTGASFSRSRIIVTQISRKEFCWFYIFFLLVSFFSAGPFCYFFPQKKKRSQKNPTKPAWKLSASSFCSKFRFKDAAISAYLSVVRPRGRIIQGDETSLAKLRKLRTKNLSIKNCAICPSSKRSPFLWRFARKEKQSHRVFEHNRFSIYKHTEKTFFPKKDSFCSARVLLGMIHNLSICHSQMGQFISHCQTA